MTQEDSPAPTAGAATTYDQSLERVLLVGGISGSGFYDDVWSWNGERWKQQASGPSVRAYAAMVYDEAREETVLFGGSEPSGSIVAAHLGDTWIFRDRVWSLAASDGPPARSSAGIAYDAERKEVILFGGFGASGALSDTWSWNGSVWTEEADTGIPARSAMGMTYDESREVVLMFGGVGGFGSTILFDDTWQWDGVEWQFIDTNSAPPGRDGHGMAFDSSRGVAVLFGGHELADSWEWDGESWTETTPDGTPAGRKFSSFAHDRNRRRTVMFGGMLNNAARRDTWEYLEKRSHLSCSSTKGRPWLLLILLVGWSLPRSHRGRMVTKYWYGRNFG